MPTLLLLAALATPAFEPPQPRLIAVAPGESLAVTLAGPATSPRVIVLVPGLLGGAHTWHRVVPLLVAGGHRVVIIEPLGTGASTRPTAADYRLEAQAERILAVLDSLHLARPVVVAHGVAGSIAMRLALRAPERVARIVSVEGGPTDRAASAQVGRALTFTPLIKIAGAGRILRGRIASGLSSASADDAWVTEQILERYSEGPLHDPGATLAVMRAMASANRQPSLGPRLHALQTPVCLILGAARHEGGPTLEEVLLLADRVPDFRIRHLPGAGHYVQEEAPEELALAIIG